jgi:hypothetical protein
MTKVETEILQTITELEQAAAVKTPGPKPELARLLARLDELTAQLSKGSDPELLHFLHRKSYQKARLLLEGQRDAITRGRCG